MADDGLVEQEVVGFDPAAGAYASDDPDRQKLRADLVSLLAHEAEDKAVLAKLEAGRAKTGGLAAGLDELPLFAAAAQAEEAARPDPLREALAALDAAVDDLGTEPMQQVLDQVLAVLVDVARRRMIW